MTARVYNGGAAATTLSGAITSGALTFSVADASTWPSSGAFSVVIDRGLVGEEKLLVASRSGNSLTITTRGYDGTSAAAHASGATIECCATATDFQEANDHINASTNVHGLSGGAAVVGTTTAQTLTNKTLTAPAVGDFTSAQHTHANAAQGGLVAATAVPYVGARVSNSANQSVPNNTLTALTFDTEQFDTNAFHDLVSNTDRLTVPAGFGGKYLILARITFAAASGTIALYLQVNGVTTVDGVAASNSSANPTLGLSTVISLAAGDYVRVLAFQTSGGAINSLTGTNGATPWFAATFLGA